MVLEVIGDPDLLSDSGSELDYQAVAYEDFGISAIRISQMDGALTDEEIASDEEEKGEPEKHPANAEKPEVISSPDSDDILDGKEGDPQEQESAGSQEKALMVQWNPTTEAVSTPVPGPAPTPADLLTSHSLMSYEEISNGHRPIQTRDGPTGRVTPPGNRGQTFGDGF